MGVARLNLHMFIRKLKNRSGSISVQLISKSQGKYKVVQTIGSGKTEQEISKLYFIAKQEKERLSNQLQLFVSEHDTIVEQVFSRLSNSSIKTIGHEIIFGKIYDYIGYNQIEEELFRHLVISRLAFPLSKLKTIDYLLRYQGVHLNINAIYRFLDKLSCTIKKQVENITFAHTIKVLGGNINMALSGIEWVIEF